MNKPDIHMFPLTEEFECPECDHRIELHDPRGSEFCICGSCQSFLQFVNEVPKKVDTVKPPEAKPILSPGTKGILKEIHFKVIGCMERQEKGTDYHWMEYVLFNAEKGYAMLSEFDGHWNIIFGKNFDPDLQKVEDETKKSHVKYNGIKYRLFHKYTPLTVGAAGEFDWNFLADKILTHEFIAPPYIIAKETTGIGRKKEIGYYRGEYLKPKVIAAAFGIDPLVLPTRQGVISNQPSPAYADLQWSMMIALIAALLVMLSTLYFDQTKPAETVFAEELNLTYDPGKGPYEFKPILSPGFQLEPTFSSLRVNISSDVSNNWLETNIVLVNETTNQTWEVTKGLEYYAGIEDGERWSEGNTSASVVLSEIPKGKYHFNIYPASGDPQRSTVTIRATANGPQWLNIVVSMILIFMIPIINAARVVSFDKKRWSYSNYSQYDN